MNRNRKAFTLIELLVVVAVISLLVSILMPSLSRAKKLAQATKCKTNMGGFSRVFQLFAAEMKDRLPAVVDGDNTGSLAACQDPADVADPTANKTEWWQKSWLSGQQSADQESSSLTAATVADTWLKNGSVYRYTGGAGMYLCPGLVKGTFASGVDSNGVFDFQGFSGLSGALINRVPVQVAPWYGPWNGYASWRSIRTPILIEAQPGADPQALNGGAYQSGINKTGTMYGAHGSDFTIGNAHPSSQRANDPRTGLLIQQEGYGNLASLDGSVAEYGRGEPASNGTTISDLSGCCWVPKDGYRSPPNPNWMPINGFYSTPAWGSW